MFSWELVSQSLPEFFDIYLLDSSGGVVLGSALLVYIILSNFDKIMYLKMTVLERHYSTKQGVRTTSMGHNTTRDSMKTQNHSIIL